MAIGKYSSTGCRMSFIIQNLLLAIKVFGTLNPGHGIAQKYFIMNALTVLKFL